MQVTDHCISIQLTTQSLWKLPAIVWPIVSTIATFSLILPCLHAYWLADSTHIIDHFLIKFFWLVCDPYAFLWWIGPIFGLSKVSLQRFWHLLNICKWIQHRSLWLDVTFAPLVPGLQPFTWLGASNVCTSFRCLYTLCYKFHVSHTTLQAMKIMLLCGFHLHSRYSIGISIYYFII